MVLPLNQITRQPYLIPRCTTCYSFACRFRGVSVAMNNVLPASTSSPSWKQPVSVLVVVHRLAEDGKGREILLLERANHPGYWQSVTGSLEAGETPLAAACREVREETGLIVQAEDLLDWHLSETYEIFPEWRHPL